MLLKNIINTPKIAIEKPQIVTKPNLVIFSKEKKVSKPKIIDKLEIANEKKNTPITMNTKIV